MNEGGSSAAKILAVAPTALPPAIPDMIEQRITVPYAFPVHFTRGLFRRENPVLRDTLTRLEPARTHRCLTVVDDGVAAAWPNLSSAIWEYAAAHADAMALVSPPHILPGGEGAKNAPAVVERVVGWVNDYRIDRQSFVLCIGGGALQDAVGYAAAIAHRGVRLVRVPTTVLSQNDSGVGVKNGINAFGKKNFTGTFAPPFAVLNDFDFLTTLSGPQMTAGMSEAVKVALIKDEPFFRWIEENAEDLAAHYPPAVEYLIRRCAQLHLEHIATSGDPFELGSARPLDFGHWTAHKLESMTQNRVGHGDAVAIGVALDTVYSSLAGHLSPAAAERILVALETLGLRLWEDSLGELDDAGRLRVLAGLGEFREHLGGELSITLLRKVGGGFEAHEIHEHRVCEAIEYLRQRDQTRCG